jgi:predicted phosphodiesterase
MRIAALSDIHGNLQALDAVLADLNRRSIDVTVNLGDLLSGGLQPRETAERLIPLGLPTVRGNHERQVLSTPPDEMGTSDRLAYQMKLPHHVRWFESLPLTLKIAAGVKLFHGSPSDDLTYLLDTVDETGARPATETEVLHRIGTETSWALMLCGHTHLPRAMRLTSGTLIVNPGSVGWPA